MPGYFAMPSGVVLTMPSAAGHGICNDCAGYGAAWPESLAQGGREVPGTGLDPCR